MSKEKQDYSHLHRFKALIKIAHEEYQHVKPLIRGLDVAKIQAIYDAKEQEVAMKYKMNHSKQKKKLEQVYREKKAKIQQSIATYKNFAFILDRMYATIQIENEAMKVIEDLMRDYVNNIKVIGDK